MDEKDLIILSELGYSVNEIGAIIDSAGVYQPEVTYGDRTISSFATPEEFTSYTDKQGSLKGAGFEYDANVETPKDVQEDIYLAKDNIKQFESNPETTPLGDINSDPTLKTAFDEVQEEKKQAGDFSYNSPDTMVDSKEADTVYEDIETEEDKNKLRAIDNELLQLATIDPSRDQQAQQEIDNSETTIGMSGRPIAAPNEDSSLMHKASWHTSKLINDIGNTMIKAASERGVGIEDEKIKKRHIELLDQKREILKPVATAQLLEIEKMIPIIEEQQEGLSQWGTEWNELGWAIYKLEKRKNSINDYLTKGEIDSNLFTMGNALDWSVGGLYGIIGAGKEARIRNKRDNGEKLTSSEEAIMVAKTMTDNVDKNGYEQTRAHELTSGLNQSFQFLRFGKYGRVGGFIAKNATRNVLKGVKGKVLTQTANAATQGIMHPMGYQYAFQDYAGNFQVTYGVDGTPEITIGKRGYEELITDNRITEKAVSEQLDKAKAEGDTQMIEHYTNMLGEIQKAALYINKPHGIGKSTAVGTWNATKEVTSELFGGPLFRWMTKPLRKLKLGKFLGDNKLNQIGSRAGHYISKNMSTLPGQGLIGSVQEEEFEEILVQLTPEVGTSWVEYVDQVGQLATWDFYAKTGLQVMAMKGGFGAMGTIQKYGNIMMMDKNGRERRTSILKMYKEMTDTNISQQEFNQILMNSGEGDFSITEYNNVIKDLKNKGLIEEANTLEQTKIYKQSVAAQKLGILPELRKSLRTAKYNKNLDPATQANILMLSEDIDEIYSDSNFYINSDEIIEFKSRRRFSKKNIQDAEKIINKIDNSKLDEEFETLKKGTSFEGTNVTLNDLLDYTGFDQKDHPDFYKNLQELVKNKYSSLSSEMQQYLALGSAKAENEVSLVKLNKHIKRITSFDYQTKLTNENNYRKGVIAVDRKRYGGKMTAKQYINEVKPNAPKSVTKHINKKRLAELDKINEKFLEKRELKNTLESSTKNITPIEDKPLSKIPEKTVVDKVTDNVLIDVAKLEQKQADKFDTKNDIIIEEGDDNVFEDESSDLLPDTAITESSKEFADVFEAQNGKKATFQDLFNGIVRAAGGDKNLFSKELIQSIGESWEAADLGKSNWEKLYKDNYTSVESVENKVMLAAFASQTKDNTIDPKETNKKSEHSSGQVTNINPITGLVERQTPVVNKTAVTNTKAGYNALVYTDETSDVFVENGKRLIKITKEDTEEIPILNESSIVNIRQLLHPEKNNPGDTWTTNITTEKEWGELDSNGKHKILVSANDPLTGVGKNNKRHFIPFVDWIKKNQEGRTMEEFEKTSEFRAKVPILYKDNTGAVVGTVADTDWYNAMNIRDISKEDTDNVNIDDVTSAHKITIDEGKENARILRNNILDKKVNKVIITTKNGSPWIKIPDENDPIPLEQASPTSQVVIFKGNKFVQLDGTPLAKDIEIVNHTDIAEVNVDKHGVKKVVWNTFYLSPVNKTDVKQRFFAINVLRKNENNEERAMSEDIETSRLILLANNILHTKIDRAGMTLADAQNISDQIYKKTGVEISSATAANNLVNSLITLTTKKTKINENGREVEYTNKYSTMSGDGNVPYTDADGKTQSGNFLGALLSKNPEFIPVQNTNINKGMSHGISIVKEGNSYKVTKLAPTYEEFLQKRLTTNVVSYNMGTEDNPAWTHSVQPIIEVEAIVESTSETESVENVIKQPDAPKSGSKTIEQQRAFDEGVQMMKDFGMWEEPGDLLPDLNETTELEKAIGTLPGLTISQQDEIIDHILAQLTTAFNSKISVDTKDFYEEQKKMLIKKRDALQQMQSEDNTLKFQQLIDSYNNAITLADTVLEKFDTLIDKAYARLQQKHLIPNIKTVNGRYNTDQEFDEDFQDEVYEKDLYKTSNEIVHKDKVGIKLKRLFSTIPSGKTVGFLNSPKYEGFDVMYNTVITLLTSPLPPNPSFDNMINKLDVNKESYPWMEGLIKALDEADEATKNSFVSNMYKYKAKAKFILFSRNKDDLTAELWDSNANEVRRKTKEAWSNNFKRSTISNNSTLNTEKLKALYAQWESWGDNKSKQPDKVLRTWLADFGIILHDNTWKDLKLKKLVTGRGLKRESVSFESLFDERTQGNLFSFLANFAKKHQNGKQNTLDFINNPNSYNPHFDMGNMLKSLIDLEITNNATFTNVTRRDGGKGVSEIIFPTFFLHNVHKLIKSADTEEKTYLKLLQSLPFSKLSTTLNLLMTNDDFGSVFSYNEVGIESLSEKTKKTNPFAKIEQLSPIDYIYHQRGQFQYDQTEGVSMQQDRFDMRISTISTPTNSDKGRMMLLKTAVYKLFSADNAFESNGDGSFNFSSHVKELLYKSLVMPELLRIIEHTDTNIKDYNDGAVRFNLMPLLNVLENKDGITAIDFLSSNKDADIFKENFFDVMTKYLEDSIKAEAKSNVIAINDFTKDVRDNEKIDTFNNAKYLAQRKTGTIQEKRLLAEYDYIINSMIANMNTMQLISGDPAMFYKAEGENVNPTSIKLDDQVKMSKDIGVNMGKRMAFMIAPGNVGAQQEGDSYIQLFLKDSNEPSESVIDIIGWHYGQKSITKEDREAIALLKQGKLSKERTDALKFKFPKAAGFLTIESTDAQEYTTLKEHLQVLVSFGKEGITQAKADEILKKSNKGTLTREDPDMDIILQPMKPVYTGDMIDEKQGVRRIMYIKSSSFPLIPALVNGTKLEPLMRKMEQLEKDYKTTVRASYQSANKVGALTKESVINPFDSKSLAKLDDVDKDNATKPVHSLTLDRINFKIQQEVPFKSDMQYDDKVSMGTQIFKLLFGDGVNKLNGFELNGKSMTGEELQDELFTVFSEMVGIQKDNLLDRLGLTDDFKAIDEVKTAKKLQKLLLEEAKERNFSNNDLKALGLQKRTINNKIITHFKLPLWFSGSSDKFESMLNAIINNKIFKQKLPGNSFVVGSEAGLQIREGIEYLKGNEIVWLGDYKGGELRGTDVLAPSKIKLDGKIIDMFETDASDNYIYIKKVDNHFEINEKMIDPALFENFTFRTPTSSHGSANNIRIVGFLPHAMGDLMITPKGFVAQMGQDFDVDKLTAYQLNHIVMSDGTIKELTEDIREEYIKKNVELIRKLKDHLKSEEKLKAFDDDFMAVIFGENIDSQSIIEEIENDIDAIKKRININYDLKLAQNKFIKIHNAIYNNPAMRTRINKVLSIDDAKLQARAIDDLVGSTNEDLNLLSPTYQMNKMIAGSTGSLAIGVYAKGITFNSSAQQSKKTIRLMQEGENGPVPNTITIGNLHSDGTFGKLETVSAYEDFEIKYDLKRRTSTVLDERVNTATDNEKAQVLGRVGITHIEAVAVDNFLAQQGIDMERVPFNEKDPTKQGDYDANNLFHKTKLYKGEQIYYTEYSIPYLLSSQPIIKEYFKRLKNAKSIISSGSSTDIDKQIAQELLGENIADILDNVNVEGLTGKVLATEISTGAINTDTQRRILLSYLSLIESSKQLKEIQSIIDVSNLGKSMWESKEKIDAFAALASDDSPFENIQSLLGTFSDIPAEKEEDQKKQLEINGVYFTPTTNQGVMVGTAMSLARNLFYEYFPYYNKYLNETINDVIDSANKKDSSDFRIVIFQEIKKYLTANRDNNLFTKSTKEERQDLFIDDPVNNHESLSTYTAKLVDTGNENESKGVKAVQNNKLLTHMGYERGEDGRPSLIRFDNTETADVSQEHYYDAFRELLINDYKLPNKNGKPYSTRMLAQDLIAYSYLSGSIVKKAIEFHKFIPIEYYIDLLTEEGKKTITRLQKYDTKLTSWRNENMLIHFVEQFFQNNPETAHQFYGEETKYVKENKSNNTMVINQKMDDYPKYVSIRNKITKDKRSRLNYNKWSLYKQVQDNKYEKIEVVGEFGMSEYDPNTSKLTTALNKNIPLADGTKKLKGNVKNIPAPEGKSFSISPGQNAQTILENIKNANIGYNPNLSNIAEAVLKMFSGNLNGIKIKVINDPDVRFRGRHTDGEVTINVAKSRIAETFIHEFVHSVTVNKMRPYYNVDWTPNNVKAPKEIQNLNILFSEYKKKLKEEKLEEYEKFEKKYASFKAGKPTEAFTDEELSIYYATVNIKEFVAISLSNNQDLLKVTSKMKYKKTNMTISEKFVEVLDKLLNSITGVENNLAEQILNTSLETVQALNPELKQEVNIEEMKSFKDTYFPDFIKEVQDDFGSYPVDDMSDPDNNNDVPFGELLPQCI